MALDDQRSGRFSGRKFCALVELINVAGLVYRLYFEYKLLSILNPSVLQTNIAQFEPNTSYILNFFNNFLDLCFQ